MNCQNHPEVPATAYCRTCGKPVCNECRRDAYGTVFCAEHAPAPAGRRRHAPRRRRAPRLGRAPRAGLRVSGRFPGAGVLSWAGFPGVGAIYNGQYAKGIVHAVVFGILCSILIRDRRPGAGIRHAAGGLDLLHGVRGLSHGPQAPAGRAGGRILEPDRLALARALPVAGVALILLGVLLLLHTLDSSISNTSRAIGRCCSSSPGCTCSACASPTMVAPKEIGHERQ